jgi:cytochrome c oxidase subunit 2
MWFIPTQLGEYDILCAEYCGLRHSYMEAKVKVIPEDNYNAWLKALPEKAAEDPGLTILKKNACTGCHSLDGSKLASTSFKGLYGKTETVVTNGTERKVKVDDEYIKTSVFEPEKDIVAGYPKGIMRSYKGMITEDEVKQIVEYLKTIR